MRQEQLALTARARRTDPETSHEAARAASDKIRESQVHVLAFFDKYGQVGATDVALGGFVTEKELMSVSGARTRRKELVDAGYLAWAGTFTKIKKRRHRIWRITEKGVKELPKWKNLTE